MSVDVAAIGAHPDDVELTVGGTLAKLVGRGHTAAIIDLTRGEAASNGTPRQRAEEAAAAARVLGVEQRINLDLGDAVIENTLPNRVKLIEALRSLRPKLVLANYWDDLHPDHCAAGRMVHDVMYPIGFVNFPAGGEACRPREFLFFMQHYPFEPSFIVDVSDHFEKKLEAIRCYGSQLHSDHEPRRPTLIGQPDMLEMIEARARHYGSLIQRRYGEPLLAPRAVPMDDPLTHYAPFDGA